MNEFTKALIEDLKKDIEIVLNAETDEEALYELHNLVRATKLTQKLIIKSSAIPQRSAKPIARIHHTV